MKPIVSIITIVFNDVSQIENTILSVLNQSYQAIEHIVIDGGSTDGTVDVIRKYANKIAYWVSEPDCGIYDAMNKGLRAATGNFVWFINSGDRIYRNDTLEIVFDNDGFDSADIIYGETMIIDEAGQEIGLRRLKAPDNLTLKSLQDGMLVCHQSIIVRRSIAPMYNLKYRLSADYDWVLKSIKASTKIENSYTILSAYLDGGTTKKNIKKGLKERFEIMCNNFGVLPTVFRHFVIGSRFFVYLFVNKRF